MITHSVALHTQGTSDTWWGGNSWREQLLFFFLFLSHKERLAKADAGSRIPAGARAGARGGPGPAPLGAARGAAAPPGGRGLCCGRGRAGREAPGLPPALAACRSP